MDRRLKRIRFNNVSVSQRILSDENTANDKVLKILGIVKKELRRKVIVKDSKALVKKLEKRQQKFLSAWHRQFSDGEAPDILMLLESFYFENREEEVTARKKLAF